MAHEEEMGLKPGENPRHVLPRHRERGEVVFNYSLKVISEAANVEYQTVRKAVSGKILDPADFRSVAQYVTRALARKSELANVLELKGRMGAQQAKWWENRWPRFELYCCAAPGCKELLFGPGACAEHGGDRRPTMKFDGSLHIVVLVGKDYMPLHRLVTQAPPGMQTHHRDGNPWNNRWENLEVLDPQEHQDRHLGGQLGAEVLATQPPRRPLRSEVGGMTKAELQAKIDEAYLRGRNDGKKKL